MERACCLFAIIAIISAAGGALAQDDDTTIFTLYRSSAVIPNARIHVATFDAADGRQYNAGNCMTAARDFQATVPNHLPPDFLHVVYWCEPGRFRP